MSIDWVKFCVPGPSAISIIPLTFRGKINKLLPIPGFPKLMKLMGSRVMLRFSGLVEAGG